MADAANTTKPKEPKPYGHAKIGKIAGKIKSLTKTRNAAAGLLGNLRDADEGDLELASIATDEAGKIVTEIKEIGHSVRVDAQRLDRELKAARHELSRLDHHAAELVREIKSHARTAADELDRREREPAQESCADPVSDSGLPAGGQTNDEQEHTETGGDETESADRTPGDSDDSEQTGGERLPGLD